MARVLLPIALLCVTVGAQTRVEPQDSFDLNGATVRIPPPDGFAATFGRFTRLRGRFGASAGTLVEVHVPVNVITDLEKSQDIDLTFYTRVTVPEGSYERDFSPDEFRELVANFEKQYPAEFDPKRSRDAMGRLADGRNVFLGTGPGSSVTMTTNLGQFGRGSNVFNGMALKRILVPGRDTDQLVAMSVLYLRKRIVSTYFYRTFHDEKDAAILRDAVKKWTAAILAANK